MIEEKRILWYNKNVIKILFSDIKEEFIMAEKRKDSKGRVLKDGEIERKDGRYEYRYKDRNGKRKSIYAKNLKELREKEAVLQRELALGVLSDSSTFDEIFQRWYSQKANQVKQNTLYYYKLNYDSRIKNLLGKLKIKNIKRSDIISFYSEIITKYNYTENSIKIFHEIIHGVLKFAINDDLILKNPADDILKEVLKQCHRTEKKQALTVKEQAIFFEYIKSSRYRGWLPLFTVLFGTGCRIGEILGLTWNDIDLKNNLISINHILQYITTPNGKYKLSISTPKTRTSVRLIPMLDEVRKALLTVREFQFNSTLNTLKVDGYTGFIFTNRNGSLYHNSNIDNAINNIVNSYNKHETEVAKSEHRKPELLPHFSCHTTRHSFATRLFENETNVKTISELLGHSNISTTMNIYTDVSIDKKQEAIKEIQGKIKIS